jgi:RNA recognition motif-containing protein
MNRKLYVGNLPYQVDETQLQSLFAQAGTVETVSVVRDRTTGQARGFAFVEMSTDAEAQDAIRQFNSADFGGRQLMVNEAKPQTARGGYGGGARPRHEPSW